MSLLLYKFRCWLDTSFKTWACGENVRTIVKATDWYTEIVVLPDGKLINVQVRNIIVRIGRKGGAIFSSRTLSGFCIGTESRTDVIWSNSATLFRYAY